MPLICWEFRLPHALAFDNGFMAHADHYWASVSITQALAWTFLVLASVIVRYSWQDRVAGLKRLGFQEQWERWKFGTPNCGTASARVCWRSIRFWLAGRNRLKPGWVLGALGLGGCVWLWLS